MAEMRGLNMNAKIKEQGIQEYKSNQIWIAINITRYGVGGNKHHGVGSKWNEEVNRAGGRLKIGKDKDEK